MSILCFLVVGIQVEVLVTYINVQEGSSGLSIFFVKQPRRKSEILYNVTSQEK